jgi:predicted house-cleaning noncanonical NTP pyrophosphatase (MazG superfamily)
MKVLKLGSVSLDGTKMKANASRHKALSYSHAIKLEEQLNAEVAELLKQAEANEQADIPDGMSIPEELMRREERLTAIDEAKAEIEQRAAVRHTAEEPSLRKENR